ncbi:MAG: putative Fe-S cluster assembly protein SufT [Gammaproteobacteria bacterium RIFCSPHIGHO2_12_FULL_37_14]|nr:MAG: putative Fe-S cluster assembly protein SufT [Gammaproteobacteria bacterium RIFCSPHIGHO2_12_FULL_37_14]
MFHAEMSVEVQRECEAALIPSGTKVSLQKGTQVLVTQMLGNSYTVYVNGNLVRISGKDGDALGLVIMEDEDINALPGTVEDKVWAQLKTCFDPEIPVNIVDLGLVYGCNVIAFPKESYRIEITMTLTAPGCGMGPILANEVEEKIRQISDVVEVKVDVVFDPPWDRSRVSDAAKLQLGLL